MGVYINGMEMPTSCYVCPFCDYVSARCDAVKGNPYTPESRYEQRAEFCPLVPVPKHGRLIDADVALRSEQPLNCSDELWAETTLARCINNAPTIIEAEDDDGT